MNLNDIKRLYGDHLIREDGTAAIGVAELKFLVNEAEKSEQQQQEIKELKGALTFEKNAHQYNFEQLEETQQEIEGLKEYIDHLEHERNLLYGRLNNIRALVDKEIK